VTHRPLTAILAATALALAACGGSGGTDERTGTGDPPEAPRDVHVSMVDNAYSPSTVDVEAGETVRFVIHNESSLLVKQFFGRSFASSASLVAGSPWWS
jgi:plastocyanin